MLFLIYSKYVNKIITMKRKSLLSCNIGAVHDKNPSMEAGCSDRGLLALQSTSAQGEKSSTRNCAFDDSFHNCKFLIILIDTKPSDLQSASAKLS